MRSLPSLTAFAVSTLLVAVVPARLVAAGNPHDQSSAVHASGAPQIVRPEALPVPTAAQLSAVQTAADALIARQDLAAYRGWLKYLKFRATADPIRMGAESAGARLAYANLVEWVRKIGSDPDVLGKLRGVQEWAYESEADGSGQPFRINIPTDYNPANPPGLSFMSHGYSGNHLEHSTGMVPRPGRFEVSVLGRARGGWYRMLSERDMMDVLAYVKATWRIDENRVDVSGGSMGGFASLWLGSRYPDLFACARPTCGFALQTAIENMINLPVYSLHSNDDPVVPVVASRGPLQLLRDAGGMVVIEETTGLGHAAWTWAEGQARSTAWGERQVRPDPASVREIKYVATDGVATGAWWAHVAEWGPRQAPATIRLRLGPANVLYGALANITRLRLDIAKSPLDRAQPLQLSLDAGKPATLAAPLPETIDIVVGADGVSFAAPAVPKVRRHTPGAAAMVYDGSPLLIVYGTRGDAATNAALRAAAVAASKSPNPSWPIDKFENAPQDGISHHQNLYGELPVKADQAVTEKDLRDRNLVLIGTTAQNSIVARLAAQLPVAEAGGSLSTSDGFSYATGGSAWALVHYNPLSPQRLILWLGSADREFYQAGALLPRKLFTHGSGADFVVLSPEGRVAAARSFDQAWNWSAAYAQSPVLPAAAATKAGWAILQADALRESGGADFGLAVHESKSTQPPRDSFMGVEGVTRYADMALLNYEMRIFTVEAKGSDLLKLRDQLKEGNEVPLRLSTNFATAAIKPDAMYSVTIDRDSLPALTAVLQLLPQSVRATGIWEPDAIEAYARQRAATKDEVPAARNHD